jgi:hypothetical protein
MEIGRCQLNQRTAAWQREIPRPAGENAGLRDDAPDADNNVADVAETGERFAVSIMRPAELLKKVKYD